MRICHKEDGIFHNKEKIGQGYTKYPVEEEGVSEVEKYYQWNKTFTQLKRTIYRLKKFSKSDYEPYICVVYSINFDSHPKAVNDREVREHCNSKQIRNRQSAIRKSLLQSTNETIPRQANDH